MVFSRTSLCHFKDLFGDWRIILKRIIEIEVVKMLKWAKLGKERVRWWNDVCTAMNLLVSKNYGMFFD
jgi:hypothetical protein